MTTTSIPGVIKRNTLFLAVGQALQTIILQLIPVIAPIIILQQTGSIPLTSLSASISWGGRIIIAYHSGRLMDKVGRVKVLVLGFALAIIGVLIMGFSVLASSFFWLVLGLIVIGFGTGIIQQNRVAVADMYPLNRRAQGIAYLLTASIVGSLFSPVLMELSTNYAVAAGQNIYALPWFLAAMLLVPALVLTLFVRPDPRDIAANFRKYYPGEDFHYNNSAGNNGKVRAENVKALLSFYPVLAAIVVSAMTQGNMTMMMGLTSLILAEHAVHISFISLSITIHIIGMYGLAIPLGRLADQHGRKKTFLIGIAISGLGAILTPLTSDYIIVTTGIFLVGLGWSAATIASTGLISDVTGPFQRGKAIGVNDMAMGVTALAFPIIGALLIPTLGFLALGYIGLIATIPTFVVAALLREKRPGVYVH